MKRDLQVQGTTVINGVEIPNVLGGFGEGKKSLTDKTIAEIHNVEVREIRQLIKNNISRFKESIDYIDLKQINQNDVFFNLDFTKAQVGNSKNIYLLSERGYAKLIKIMDSDIAWDIHDKLIDEYFAMREVINSDENLKKELAYKLMIGGIDSIEAHKQLVALETRPLIEKIEKDKDKVEFAETVQRSNDTVDFNVFSKILSNEGIKIGRNKLFELLRNEDILMTGVNHNQPYQKFVNQGYFKVIEYTRNEKIGFKTVITGKGQQWLIKLFKDNKLTKTA
ncbi:phage antirepressor KilAC domain-containing protein [Paraclostridium sordellii]|uniref:phage antirepressor KilAC domain-containing protein n=1 Tax=Paraclostridium sordellii TaxID=1505 RepID=UPI001C615E9D|nr:phage antirepressor KilAC domain-containing protein [Paeniclostridium sordellii]QYE96679.1 phage antirepressor KilAC domain-containing protein [Paeniclostridium sordellii]